MSTRTRRPLPRGEATPPPEPAVEMTKKAPSVRRRAGPGGFREAIRQTAGTCSASRVVASGIVSVQVDRPRTFLDRGFPASGGRSRARVEERFDGPPAHVQ